MRASADIGLKRLRGASWLGRLQPAVGPLLLLAIWWLAALTGLLNTRLIPGPGPTFATTWQALVHGTMSHDLARTLMRVLYAFAPEALQDFMQRIEPYGFFIIIALVLWGGASNLLGYLNQFVLNLLF